MAALSNIALFVVILTQIALLLWVHRATSVMREEWPRVVKATPARVYVIQHQDFWGPVMAIVPKRCREIEKWQKMVQGTGSTSSEDTNRWQSDGQAIEAPMLKRAGLSPSANEIDRFAAGFHSTTQPAVQPPSSPAASSKPRLARVEDVPHEEMLRSKLESAGARQLADAIVVDRCNETMHFEGVTHLHRYLSMISFDNHIRDESMTGEELHEVRIRSYRCLLIGIVICMVLKYLLKVTDICAQVVGHRYVQLWNQGRTKVDKVLESLMLHGASIVFTLAMQMTLCGLFLSFWHEDHFIMMFVPGFGFSVFFSSLVIFCIAMVVDRCQGYMARCSDCYIYVFWSLWLLWMVFLAVPMIGDCIYSVNFMWRVSDLGWLSDEHEIFSASFVRASRDAAMATYGFVIVAVLDMLVILLQDLTEKENKVLGLP